MFLRIGLLPKPIVLERIRVTVDRLETRRRLAPLSVTAVERAELLRSTWGDAVSLARSRIPYTAGPCPGSLTGKVLYMPDVPWEFCVRYRGHTVRPAVWIDERPAALEELVMYHPAELYAMEFYGAGLTAGRGPIVPQIRVYTVRFVERGGRLRPLWF